MLNKARLDELSPADREAALEAIEVVTRGVEMNPLITWRPHPKQAVFLSSNSPIKAFLGGNQSGKSTAGLADDVIQAIDREVLPTHLLSYKHWEPPFYARIVVPDLNYTLDGVVIPKLRDMIPKGQLIGQSFDEAYDKNKRILRFTNGSWFQFMTFEQDLDKFGGATLHRVHFDEEPPEDIRKECRMRLMKYGGDELFTMTPLLGMTWLYDAVYERRHEDHITVVQVDMDDNPYLTELQKSLALEGLSEEERRARKEGRFVHFAGLVFDELDESKHFVSDPDPDHLKGQDIVVGIDPGVRFTGVSFIAFDQENEALMFDELLEQGETIETVSNRIKGKLKDWSLNLDDVLFVIDPSARNRQQINAENIESEFARFDIFCMHGQNELEAGILQMKRRLQAGSFTVARRCEYFIRQASRYRIDNRTPGRFAVVKVDDHVIDSVRYALMARSWGGVPAETRVRRRRWNESYPPPRRNNIVEHPLGGMA